MLTWLIVLAVITVFCIIVHPIQKPKSLFCFEKNKTKYGNFEMFGTIEGKDYRDFEFTLSFDPRYYFSFEISLWYIAFGAVWYRYESSHLDCERDHGESVAVDLLQRILNEEAYKFSDDLREAICTYLERKGIELDE